MSDSNDLAPPDVEEIHAHLEWITAQAGASERGLIEIAYAGSDGKPNRAQLFDMRDLDAAAEFAAEVNAHGNVYFGAALRDPEIGRHARSSKADVTAALAVWADFDKPETGDAAIKEMISMGMRPNRVILTGAVPHRRLHVYWLLEEPCPDIQRVEAINGRIAAMFGGDPAVKDASRILRLPGTTSWARKEGRVNETIVVEPGDWRGEIPYDIIEIEALLDQKNPALALESRASQPSNSGDFWDLNGAQAQRTSVDAASALERAAEPGEWHRNALQLVGRLVAKGHDDQEILALAVPALQQPGYSLADTRREVQVMIRGAREKGWAPATGPQQAFDPSMAPTIPFHDWSEAWRPRIWLLHEQIERQKVSLIAAAGGIGKTALASLIAAQAAVGGAIHGSSFYHPRRVIYFSGEDDGQDVPKRVDAAAIQIGADPARVKDNVKVALMARLTKRARAIVNVDQHGQAQVNTAMAAAYVAAIKEHRADLVIFDPIVEFSEASDNDQAAQSHLYDALRTIASRQNVAVLVLVHTPKGTNADSQSGNPDIVRGSGVATAAARSVFTLFSATEKDCEKWSIPEDDRPFVIKLHGGKNNNAALPTEPMWFRRVSVEIAPGIYEVALREISPKPAARREADRELDAGKAMKQEATWTLIRALATSGAVRRTGETGIPDRAQAREQVSKTIPAPLGYSHAVSVAGTVHNGATIVWEGGVFFLETPNDLICDADGEVIWEGGKRDLPPPRINFYQPEEPAPW